MVCFPPPRVLGEKTMIMDKDELVKGKANRISNECAFPMFGVDTNTEYGLTKREYFAAIAMQGLLSNPEVVGTLDHDGSEDYDEILATESVKSADALLKALAEREVADGR
jgi:hypothetical protein